ncbi:MAG: hypothetical protein AB7O68_17345, partial [Pirellulales bacterium]
PSTDPITISGGVFAHVGGQGIEIVSDADHVVMRDNLIWDVGKGLELDTLLTELANLNGDPIDVGHPLGDVLVTTTVGEPGETIDLSEATTVRDLLHLLQYGPLIVADGGGFYTRINDAQNGFTIVRKPHILFLSPGNPIPISIDDGDETASATRLRIDGPLAKRIETGDLGGPNQHFLVHGAKQAEGFTIQSSQDGDELNLHIVFTPQEGGAADDIWYDFQFFAQTGIDQPQVLIPGTHAAVRNTGGTIEFDETIDLSQYGSTIFVSATDQGDGGTAGADRVTYAFAVPVVQQLSPSMRSPTTTTPA